MINALVYKDEASALADLLKWHKNDVSSCVGRAILMYRRLLRAKRDGLLIQFFHPDGRIEDVEV